MTTQVDLYYTMRSPYCYLATPVLSQMVQTYDVHFNLKPVYPLAVSDASFFSRVNPLWPPYLMRDTRRIAARLGVPFHWPRPDPIVQDTQTREVAAEQPYIRRLTYLAQLAAEAGCGLEYVTSVSALLYNPDVDGWDQGDHLSVAVQQAGLDFAEFTARADAEAERLEAAVQKNRQDQLAAGHWGAPLFVHADVQGQEIFFGQDRLVDLEWHLLGAGMGKR
ncbi:MAG: DsbA family protein [Pseudomonadota bacterium]